MRSRGACARVVLVAALLSCAPLVLTAPCARASDRLAIHERALNIDHDPGLEALEVRWDARFAVPGTYSVLLYIADPIDYYGLGGATWAPGTRRSPFPGGAAADPGISGWYRVTTDSLGRASLTSYFYCDELSRMQADGPWLLRLLARCRTDLKGTVEYSDAAAPRETLAVMTRPWRRSQFDFNYHGELSTPDYDPFEWRPGHELVFTQGYDLLAATVVAADSAGTQGDPPVVTMRLDEVLRGARKPGNLRVVWAPQPLWMPCPTGEEGNIRRWERTPIESPALGSRWILGGYAVQDSNTWLSVQDCRWVYSDRLREHFLAEAAPWAERVRLLKLKREALVLDFQRRNRIEARRAQARKDSSQTAVERVWLAREQARSRNADIDELVRGATRIVIGRMGAQPWSGNPITDIRIARQLTPTPSDTTTSRRVFVGAREMALMSRWKSAPVDLTPGPHAGPPVLCIAFLCDRYWGYLSGDPAPVCRVADANDGLLLADAGTLRRVEAAIAAKPRPRSHGPARALTWDELKADRDSTYIVDLKLSPLGPPGRYGVNWYALALSCGHDPAPSWVLSRAIDPSRYYVENLGHCSDVALDPKKMAALLDSLAVLPAVRSRRVITDDALSLTLRRTVGNQETQFECTMDTTEVAELARVMARVFHERPGEPSTREARTNVPYSEIMWSWFHNANRDYGKIWDATFRP